MTRTQIEIVIGIVLVLATAVVLVFYGLTEEQRMARSVLAQEAEAIEVGAALFELNCSGCHGPQGLGVEGIWPPLNDRHFFSGRLAEVGWSGTQEDYIIATVSSGRLISTRPDQYPGQGRPVMPAWSEDFGGPLRKDQIQSIARFVVNWEPTAGQVSAPITDTLPGPPVGTDITKQLPEGDAARGEQLATDKGCVVCHINTPTGPAWLATADEPGIGARTETRLGEPGYTGSAQDAHQYLFESIVLPNVHIVEGFQPIMPANYGETMTDEDLADLIAYLLTLE